MKILFLAANPLDTGRLRLEAEARDIEEGLLRANQRDSFTFVPKLAVRVKDFMRSLLDSSPDIVHFSGHGSGSEGIVLENSEGESVLIGTNALANLFALHKETINCVVLNACYSSTQAEAIAQHIPFVIGMSSEILDESANVFAVGFYDALGAGRSIEKAFLHGKNAIEMQSLPDYDLPILLKGSVQEHRAEMPAVTPIQSPTNALQTATSEHLQLVQQLTATALEITQFVQCIGMHKPVSFDQIYQPTKLLVRSGLTISASAAFDDQNRIAQSIALSEANQFRSTPTANFLESPEDAVIFAGPGWGKTTFLHHIFRRSIVDKGTTTILITLRRDGAVGELEKVSKYYLAAANVVLKSRVLLLVDGYDEVTTSSRKSVSESLVRFKAAGVGRFILTCRDNYQVIDLFAAEVRIDGFDLQDKYRFVAAFLSAFTSAHDPIKMVDELESKHLSDFLSHPLLLALACIVKSGQRGEQPRSAIRLLRMALTTLTYAWDREKGVAREKLTQLDGDDRMQILQRIAFASKTPFLKGNRAENIARKVIERMPVSKVDPLLVLTETAQFYGILVPTVDGWEFVHRSIQDYLAAQHWVDSGGFVTQERYEWNTRTAYAASLSSDATRVIEGALASSDGMTCVIETLSTGPNFDFNRVSEALLTYYKSPGRVNVWQRDKLALAAAVETDLFAYLSPRFLNFLIEKFVKGRDRITEVLLGHCISELRQRKLRMDFTTFAIVQAHLPNLRFQFRLSERPSVTAEMARPISASDGPPVVE